MKLFRKTVIFLIIGLFLGSSIISIIPITVEAYPGEIIDWLECQGFWPTGLTWDGQYLWNADLSDDKIYKINPSIHSIIDSFDSVGGSPWGLAWDGQYIWSAENEHSKIYKLNPSDGSVIKIIESPGMTPYGLTWDGDFLWNADLNNRRIYKIDPSDGEIIYSFSCPGIAPTGLAWDGEYLWNADFDYDKIYKLDPSNGKTIDTLDSPGKRPTGLAWDGDYLWVVSEYYKKIYQIDVIKNPPQIPEEPTGPISCYTINDYLYETSTIDPDEDQVRYGWDWDGNGMVDNWTDYHPSGDSVEASHAWSVPGTYYVKVLAEDLYGSQSGWSDSLTVTVSERPLMPRVNCEGTLNWYGVKPNELIIGSFTVSNIGEPGSELDWKVESYPDWGNWTFIPESGDALKPSDDAVVVEVFLQVPDEQEKRFSGEIIVLNEKDSNDFCKIPISLTTPKNKALNFQISFLRFLEKHIELFPILRYILRF